MRPPGPAFRPTPERVVLSYVVALVCVAVATLLTFPIRSISVHSLSLFFTVAVLIASWHGGLWPGMFSVVLATASFEYFFSAHALSEDSAVDDMRTSVNYWKEALAAAGRDAG